MPVEEPDSLAVKEQLSIFDKVEAHGLSVRKWAAGLCFFLIFVLYTVGLALLWQSALFAKHLCTPAVPEKHAASPAGAASSLTGLDLAIYMVSVWARHLDWWAWSSDRCLAHG